ncbi:deoxyuridine 5'-triphosphate nucleotidohydrolase [Salicibibacter cibarius]|uniref:dUTP diphosphatase n=1 Tax=Salicibibacter cibarius TaxID=2743000 RepID=A0A7T6Z241_9BACI|nr:deoxyuridine 5'-triphosphate nucleotidohydrolase [Salicibibacter cibarius]QQK75583.1 deoxyuridine 5'-triphosphate nucleotidohydrolase [Salicibibacter cibarius]
MTKISVEVKKLHKDAVIPTYGSLFAAGFDLYATEDMVIAPGETKMVQLGLAFAIPVGFEIQIRPRSGVSIKTKLRIPNSPGTIDADYRGEVAIPLENHNSGASEEGIYFIDGSIGDLAGVPDGSYFIRKHDRIAQGVLKEVPQALFAEVDELDNTERGSGGFGSTGTR